MAHPDSTTQARNTGLSPARPSISLRSTRRSMSADMTESFITELAEAKLAKTLFPSPPRLTARDKGKARASAQETNKQHITLGQGPLFGRDHRRPPVRSPPLSLSVQHIRSTGKTPADHRKKTASSIIEIEDEEGREADWKYLPNGRDKMVQKSNHHSKSTFESDSRQKPGISGNVATDKMPSSSPPAGSIFLSKLPAETRSGCKFFNSNDVQKIAIWLKEASLLTCKITR